MKANMGTIDRVVRIIVALVVAILFFTDQISGLLGIILGVFAIVFALTSVMGWCPLYSPLKISTVKKGSDN